jgi:hypothetical protein
MLSNANAAIRTRSVTNSINQPQQQLQTRMSKSMSDVQSRTNAFSVSNAITSKSMMQNDISPVMNHPSLSSNRFKSLSVQVQPQQPQTRISDNFAVAAASVSMNNSRQAESIKAASLSADFQLSSTNNINNSDLRTQSVTQSLVQLQPQTRASLLQESFAANQIQQQQQSNRNLSSIKSIQRKFSNIVCLFCPSYFSFFEHYLH